jgi:hypothetical protein
MEFKRRHPVRSKIAIDNKIIGVNSFNYLENLISYEKEVDIYNKFNNYLNITGFIKNNYINYNFINNNYLNINSKFRLQKTLKETKIKLYNMLALPAL